MLRSFQNARRIGQAVLVLAQYDVLVPPELAGRVSPLMRVASRLARAWGRRRRSGQSDAATAAPGQRLAVALQELGPAYIKLGQFIATRPDIVGAKLAADLKGLQDRLPPFPVADAKAAIEREFTRPLSALYDSFGDAVAAASIAQVHRAHVASEATLVDVAVKVLRPGIEAECEKQLDAFAFAARLVERFMPSLRRLEPVKLVATLRDSMMIEMDLRLEAAAASELKENDAGRQLLRVPTVDWQRTSRRVLTLEWIDGISVRDLEKLDQAGWDRQALAARVIEIFLTQALCDGFFHADMHQGNLFVDGQGRLVAVDFGIMGRLDFDTRRYLAEILFGFLMRDYQRLSRVHFDAGYVTSDKSQEAFAQALRSVGEPIFGRDAEAISMSRLLAQLFDITQSFDMHLQPQLVLLQKTMVVVEGIARDLDPHLNIWETSRPIVRNWMEQNLGVEARLRQAAEGAALIGRALSDLPEALRNLEAIAAMMRREGLRLHPDTARAIAAADHTRQKPVEVAVWVGAVALAVIALTWLL